VEAAMSQEMLLQMRSIRKTYGGIHALKGVNLDLKKGETLGLIGENGAGKSTLMRILCGIEKPDGGAGEILFENQEIRIANPHHAQELGIAMIPQELVLVPQMTVVENLFLGRETVGRARFLDKRQMIGKTEKIMADLQSEHINPEAVVGSIPKADQQVVAIGRRLLQGGKIFIMDEPTAAFTEKETKNLFNVIRKICSSARSVIFISHRLEEVLEICDRITILRDGEMITTLLKGKGVDKSTLIYHMVGSEIKEEFPKIEVERGREIFRAENIAFHTNQGKLVKNINFSVHQGEVVGVTGLVGVGKTEMGQAILGLRRICEGALYLDDSEILLNSPIDAATVGFGYVSEDRRGEGLVSDLPSLHNMTINSLKKISRNGVILPKKERELGGGVAARLTMKKEYLDMEAQQLSGGNQQKVVIVRQIIRDARIIIFDEPTKGIDVAAKREVARLIGELSKEKKAILLLSSEPREVLGISDTIFVLTKDGMEGPFPRDSIDYEQLMAIEFGKGPDAR
jgi:ribose transport system ATP-binding protein